MMAAKFELDNHSPADNHNHSPADNHNHNNPADNHNHYNPTTIAAC